MTRLPDISIIGPGRVGTAIGILAVRAGFRVVALGGRNRDRTAAATAAVGGAVRACSIDEAAGAGGLVLLTVPDDAIELLCRHLAEAGAFRPEAIVAHCSGALSSDILASARRACGCAVGSLHPLQTFPTAEAAVRAMNGTWCFCEGDDRAVETLEALAWAVGGRPVRIAPADKALYHAAAVMACNYLAALMDAAAALCERTGIDRPTAVAAMTSIAAGTLRNVAEMGPAEALTGPIARGDSGTLRRHLEALAGCDGRLGAFYRAAGAWTVDLAERKGTLDPATAKKLRELLTHREE